MAKKNQATEISTKLWGGVFHSDNRGYYSALEFFALVDGVHGTGGEDDLLPERDWDEPLEVHTPPYILARQLAFGAGLGEGDPFEGSKDFIHEELQPVISSLLMGLKLHVPNTGKAGRSWSGSHFVPYGKHLPHWDARTKRGKPLKERIYLRGAGTLAYKIVATDPNPERLQAVRAAFTELLRRDHFFGHLLGVFRGENEVSPDVLQPLMDRQIAPQSEVREDDWDELLRSAVHAIVTHPDAPHVVKLDALFHGIPAILVALQLGRAAEALGQPRMPILVDCSPSQLRTHELRQASHRSFTRADRLLRDGLRVTADLLSPEAPTPAKKLKQFQAYFTRGAPAFGLVNALKGARRFVLREPLLEALVLATGRQEMTFEDFVETWLHKRFGFVIDPRAAQAHGLDREADLSLFEDNARYLAETLSEIGLLQSYSDDTRMVRYGVA